MSKLGIGEFQRWIQEYDQARGWDRTLPVHSLLHAMEEMGEVSRLVLKLDGYKPDADAEGTRAELGEELSDLVIFLFKMAYQYGIDMEAELRKSQLKADERYPDLEAAAAELERYLNDQERNLARLRSNLAVEHPQLRNSER